MIDFSWKVFSITGDIDSYLVYKELENSLSEEEEGQNEEETVDSSSY
ncbi:YqzL family protein [Texcoconibacillus texcoconensis]|uniref:YqzL family protein n=1 Tax=Texcoconibacillus texcoconensis TaxID=1095777 RepID=A0A840QR51_9BACI|nr:YqzL family protein [Texcoconibacillus texcoconensis]MBB5173932.1 hypothetical protein [Texcoconibacillus texcoconensis]